MAILSLLFNKPKKVEFNAPLNPATFGEDRKVRQLLIIDAATEISHQYEQTPTTNPVEDGSIITDHVEIQPEKLTIQGTISEAPIGIEQALLNNIGGVIATTAGIGGGLKGGIFAGAVATLGGKLLNNPGTRVQDAFNTIIELRDKSIPIDIITGLKGYNNMILTNFNPIETAENGDSLVFTASFQRITLVSSDTIALPVTKVASAVKKTNKGKQNSKEGDDQTDAKNQTILKRIFDSAGITGGS